MYTIEASGKALTHQKVVPGNTITSLGSEFYTYTERKLAYTSGGTTEIVVGDWIVGATGSAKAEVVGVALASGTWAGGDAAGTLYIRCQHGSFQSENIKVAAGTNEATIAANSVPSMPGDYIYPELRGRQARSVMINVTGATALCLWNGGKPDQTALVGFSLPAISTTTLTDTDSIKNFRCVDYASGSASTLNVTYYYS